MSIYKASAKIELENFVSRKCGSPSEAATGRLNEINSFQVKMSYYISPNKDKKQNKPDFQDTQFLDVDLNITQKMA